MLQTIFGFVVLALPFIIVFNFEDKKKGFLTILAGWTTFSLGLALISQYLHIFSYSVVLTIFLLVDFGCLFWFYKKAKYWNLRLDWLVVLALVLVSLQFYSAHFDYSGLIGTINGYAKVKNYSYPYPSFSDEWVSASLVNYSINNHSLPTVNPLFGNGHWPNLFVPYFSTLSQIFLILNLNPFSDFALMSVVLGTIITGLTVIVLWCFGVGRVGIIFSILSLPLLTNAGNLPGLWFLMPYLSAVGLWLASLGAFAIGVDWLFYVFCLLAIVFYPPILAFVLPVFLVRLIQSRSWLYIRKSIFWLAISAVIILVLVFLSSPDTFLKIWSDTIEKIVRTNLVGGIPSFNIFYIIPIFVLLASLLGVYRWIKEKFFILLAPLSVGGIFWLVYSFTEKVLIIDGPRVVMIVSIVLVLASGWGVEQVLVWMKKDKLRESVWIGLVVVSFFICLLPFYPNTNYQKLILKQSNGQIKYPNPPINSYLSPGDLIAFEGITKQVFLAPAWKGLTIGAITQNYPLESKESIISNHFLSYGDFIKANCDTKSAIIKKRLSLNYIYSAKFSCPGFTLLKEGGDGLFLYKVDR